MKLIYVSCGPNFGLRAFDLDEIDNGEWLEDTTGFAFGSCSSIFLDHEFGRGTIEVRIHESDIKNGFGETLGEIISLPFICQELYDKIICKNFS